MSIASLKLNTPDNEFEFTYSAIQFHSVGITNLFALKNNKTVSETLEQPKYKGLLQQTQGRYAAHLHAKLGEFLFDLKTSGDSFYKQFLNKYGDGIYCKFSITEHVGLKGLYCYVTSGNLRYIGRSHDPFGRRINHGYGNISPKNCYRDGQSTNCHLNSLVALHSQDVAIYVYALDDHLINQVERTLIQTYKPDWNTALKND